jgi:hypothetical protein
MDTKTELEALARAMLAQYVSIAPYDLVHRAGIRWPVALELLLDLVRKGQARPVRFGRFAAVGPVTGYGTGSSWHQKLMGESGGGTRRL